MAAHVKKHYFSFCLSNLVISAILLPVKKIDILSFHIEKALFRQIYLQF